MTRIRFKKNEQRSWIKSLLRETKVNKNQLATICKVTTRTINAWIHEDTTISEEALMSICRTFNKPLPKKTKRLKDYWYVRKGARKGGFARLKLYGPPGSFISRQKGGLISQLRRRENPTKYLKLGCRVKKSFTVIPDEQFAEFIGLLLGDGSVSSSQVRITVNSLVDMQYSKYIELLMNRIFGYIPSTSMRKEDHTISITMSGIGLIELLEKWGVKQGNKIRQQVDIPDWIMKNTIYKRACVRGLMDTDGGIYFHNHNIKGNRYRNIGLCFTSFSFPLLNSVSNILQENGIKFSMKKNRIFIYNLEYINRYFKVFNTHNLKNIQKLGEVA